MTDPLIIIQRLEGLLPELQYSRETHVQWRDCDQSYRDRNPEIGEAEFHARAVQDYDNRICVIRDAIEHLRALSCP